MLGGRTDAPIKTPLVRQDASLMSNATHLRGPARNPLV